MSLQPHKRYAGEGVTRRVGCLAVLSLQAHVSCLYDMLSVWAGQAAHVLTVRHL